MKIRYSTLLLLAGLPQVANAQSYTCKACAAGTYGGDGKVCTPCPAGTASNKIGVSSCPACSAGTYTSGSSTGNTTCTRCEAGYSCTGKNNHDKCSAGTYATGGASSCTNCPAGQYNTAAGASGCTTCEAGYRCTGKNNHDKCSAGTYATGGASSCTNCKAGTYNTAAGASGCTRCEAGWKCGGKTDHQQCTGATYATGGASSCSSCGANVADCNHQTGAVTKCNSGYYKNGNACTICPAGTYCPDGVNKKECADGWYQQNQGQSSCIKSNARMILTFGTHGASGLYKSFAPGSYTCSIAGFVGVDPSSHNRKTCYFKQYLTFANEDEGFSVYIEKTTGHICAKGPAGTRCSSSICSPVVVTYGDGTFGSENGYGYEVNVYTNVRYVFDHGERITCGNYYFGDPAGNVTKQCSAGYNKVVATEGGWFSLSCNSDGTMKVSGNLRSYNIGNGGAL